MNTHSLWCADQSWNPSEKNEVHSDRSRRERGQRRRRDRCVYCHPETLVSPEGWTSPHHLWGGERCEPNSPPSLYSVIFQSQVYFCFYLHFSKSSVTHSNVRLLMLSLVSFSGRSDPPAGQVLCCLWQNQDWCEAILPNPRAVCEIWGTAVPVCRICVVCVQNPLCHVKICCLCFSWICAGSYQGVKEDHHVQKCSAHFTWGANDRPAGDLFL